MDEHPNILNELAEMLSRYNLLRNNLEKLFFGCSQVFGWNWEGGSHGFYSPELV
jgi:hypothetical protein